MLLIKEAKMQRALLLLLGLTWISPLAMALTNSSSAFDGKAKDYQMKINILSFDPSLGDDLMVRLTLNIPQQEQTPIHSPREDLWIIDEYTVDNSILKINKSEPYSAFNAGLNTRYEVESPKERGVFDYPFDKYTARIQFYLARNPTTADDKDSKTIPLSIDCSQCTIGGFNVQIRHPQIDEREDKNIVYFLLEIERNKMIKIFSIFWGFMMISISIGVMVITLRMIKSGICPNLRYLSFNTALMFAFPAVRNLQPHIPPIGTLSDYYGFIPAELIVVTSLLLVIIISVKRFNPSRDS